MTAAMTILLANWIVRAVQAAVVTVAAVSFSVILVVLLALAGVFVSDLLGSSSVATTGFEEQRESPDGIPLYIVVVLASAVFPVASFVSLLTRNAAKAMDRAMQLTGGAIILVGVATVYMVWNQKFEVSDGSWGLNEVVSSVTGALVFTLFQWLAIRLFLWAAGIKAL